MFVLNIFLASLIFFLFKGAYAVLDHEYFTVGTRYGHQGHISAMPVSDAFLPYYVSFLIFMGIFFVISIFWYNKKKVQERQPEDEKGLQDLGTIGTSLLINNITPLFMIIAMVQSHIPSMFYAMITMLLIVELYFGRTSSTTLMLSLFLLYLGDGTAYSFLFNGAVILLIVAVASRLARSLYGEPVIKDSLAD